MLLVRDGAIGDVIQVTPAIRAWAQAGFRVTVCTHRDTGDAVLANNPYVAAVLDMPHALPWLKRKAVIANYVKRHGLDSNRWIDLAGSCEGRYLWHSNRAEYTWPEAARRATNRGVNYVRHINCDLAGAPDARMELFANSREVAWCNAQRARFAGKRIMYLQLHGSSLNKAWPYWPLLVAELHKDPSLVVVTGGSPRAAILERGIHEMPGVDHRRFLPLASNGGPAWTLRHSILMTRAAHVVVGPETGLINAAMAWGTPTVILHSHAAPENLVPEEHRRNVWSLTPDNRAPCAPCYKIVGDEDGCDTCDWGDFWLRSAYRCMAAIEPSAVYEKVTEVLDGIQSAHLDHDDAAERRAPEGLPPVRARRPSPDAEAAIA